MECSFIIHVQRTKETKDNAGTMPIPMRYQNQDIHQGVCMITELEPLHFRGVAPFLWPKLDVLGCMVYTSYK